VGGQSKGPAPLKSEKKLHDRHISTRYEVGLWKRPRPSRDFRTDRHTDTTMAYTTLSMALHGKNMKGLVGGLC